MPLKSETEQPRAGRPEPKPIGLVIDDGDWLDLIRVCDDRVDESRTASDEWNAKADRNKVVYYAGEDPPPPKNKICFNRIRSEVKASVNQSTREPATIKLKPVETNDPGEFYSFDPAVTTEPIDPAMAQMLQQPVPTGQADPATGQEVMAPGMSLFKMDDKSTADFWQRQFDVHFKRGRIWPSCRQAAFDAAIFGFKFPLFEFNQAEKKCKVWTSVSVWDTHTDAIGCDNFEESQFFGVDWLLEAGQARQMFPEYTAQINEFIQAGNMRKSGRVMLGGGKDRTYERNMIILRHMWLRNQPILMTQDEVIQSGALPTQDVETVPAMMDETGGMIPPQMETQLAPDPATGLPPQPMISDDDGMTHNPDWPTKLVTRHVVYLPGLNKGVVDEQCAYSDIPAAWIPGDPVPGQLFGTGYPESFLSPQMAENRIINAAVEYVEQYPNPGATIRQDAADAIAKGLKGHMVRNNDMLIVPNQVADAAGGPDKCIAWNVPPPLPPAVAQVLDIIQAKNRETAVNPEASMGKLPAGQATSGVALQLLQTAAQNQFSFPQQWFNEMVQRIAGLMLNALIKWLSIEDLMKVCSEYPPHIIQAFQRRGATAEWDIDVTLSTDVGFQRAKERTDAIEAYQVIDPTTGRPLLSPRTMSERFEESYDEENRRWDEAAQQPAAIAMQQQQQAEQEQEKPSGKSGSNGSSNGNGQHASNGNGRF